MVRNWPHVYIVVILRHGPRIGVIPCILLRGGRMKALSDADAKKLASVERMLTKSIDNRNTKQANALRVIKIINKKLQK